jgi:hypothetical protein
VVCTLFSLWRGSHDREAQVEVGWEILTMIHMSDDYSDVHTDFKNDSYE